MKLSSKHSISLVAYFVLFQRHNQLFVKNPPVIANLYITLGM